MEKRRRKAVDGVLSGTGLVALMEKRCGETVAGAGGDPVGPGNVRRSVKQSGMQ